jgi:hypothetical protein
MALVEYPEGAAFPGVIGRTTDESSPAWPAPVRATKGAPNVLFVVLDDTGFGQLGCYGSPIATPNFDALAAGGLRFSNMHTTALCSPSRSCIITGRNHHSNSMACITELASGYPGYNGVIPFENGMLSEMLLEHGYNTYMVGKWHLTPSNQETAAGPYDRWPLARGFERFYGFLGGDTSQWYPDLVYDNHQVEPPATPEEGYHLTPDLIDKSIEFIADAKQIDPDKPFYLHLCFGATHAPHHVPKEWADKYAGQFDDGWDAYREKVFARQKELGIVPANAELSRHDPDVPDWDSLPEPARKLFSRMMEVFAGFLSHTDNHQVEPPATPEEATTSPPTSSTSRSRSSPTPSRSTPTNPSTCTSASAPRTRRTTCPRSGPTSTPASSTTAGTPTARRPSPARRSWASSPRAPNSPATIPTCRIGTRCLPRRASSTAA